MDQGRRGLAYVRRFTTQKAPFNFPWLTWLGLVVALIVIVTLGLTALGSARWIAATQSLMDGLEAGRLPTSTGGYDARELVGLPAAVQRYFGAALTDGQPIATVATIEMTGSFNMSNSGEPWRPFTSRQRVRTRRPGFFAEAAWYRAVRRSCGAI